MKQLIKTKESIVYCCFALIFILFALVGKWDNSTAITIFSAPFVWLGDGIRYIGATSLAIAYILYIFIGLTPLIFPLYRAIKTKKLFLRDIMWLILSVFLLVILYFFINPHKIEFILFKTGITDTLKKDIRNITLLGFSFTAYAILLFSLLGEAYLKLKKEERKVYPYAKILFSVLIIGVLFNLFFIELLSVKTGIKNIPNNTDLINSINIDKPINIFVIILAYVIKLVPAAFTILLFLQSKDFIGNLQADAFSKNNIPKLNAIIKSCTLLIFISLGTMILENIVYLLLSDKLLNAYYRITIPVAMILAACLILIFSKILIKSIEINEENKLVI